MGRPLRSESHLQDMKSVYQSMVDLNGEVMKQLCNPCSHEYCQIFEIHCKEDSELPIKDHVHESNELFYQVKGKLVFSDGHILNEGEFRHIKGGERHGIRMRKGSICIVIISPPV